MTKAETRNEALSILERSRVYGNAHATAYNRADYAGSAVTMASVVAGCATQVFAVPDKAVEYADAHASASAAAAARYSEDPHVYGRSFMAVDASRALT